MTFVNGISNNPLHSIAPSSGSEKTGSNDFHKTLKALISQVDNQIKDTNRMTEEFAIGKNHDLHEVIIASEKADISFQFLLKVRNKLLEAYQEIMRMNF